MPRKVSAAPSKGSTSAIQREAGRTVEKVPPLHACPLIKHHAKLDTYRNAGGWPNFFESVYLPERTPQTNVVT